MSISITWQAKREVARSDGAARKKGALVPREQAYHATSLATQSHRAAAPSSLQLVSNNVTLCVTFLALTS